MIDLTGIKWYTNYDGTRWDYEVIKRLDTRNIEMHWMYEVMFSTWDANTEDLQTEVLLLSQEQVAKEVLEETALNCVRENRAFTEEENTIIKQIYHRIFEPGIKYVDE